MADPNPDYFRFIHVGWIVFVSAILYCITMAYFNPEGIPWFLGPIGQLSTYLGTTYPIFARNLFYLTIILHTGETIYCIKVCRDKNLNSTGIIKWSIQTFIFGFSSLLTLIYSAPKIKST